MSKKNMFTQRHYIAIVEVLNKYKDDMTGIDIFNDIADLFKNEYSGDLEGAMQLAIENANDKLLPSRTFSQFKFKFSDPILYYYKLLDLYFI